MLPSITKKGEIESTFALRVVLVINDNILCGWTNAFIKYVSGNSITLAMAMTEEVDPSKC